MARHLIPSDATLRGIKPGDARKRLNDGDGLYLLLFVKGGAHGWRLDYSIGGRRKTLSLGTYPDTGLALARRKADDYRKLVRSGIDPSGVRKEDKAASEHQREQERRAVAGEPAPGSFEAIAREWHQTVHVSKVSTGHAARTLIRFEKDVFPWIGQLQINEITPLTMLSVGLQKRS